MNWYVIRSCTRQEARALDGLTELGLSAYMPMGVRWHARKTPKEKVTRPLYPGYLFVRCTPTQFRAVLETDGVHDFLCAFNSAQIPVPIIIPDFVVNRIRDEEERGVYDDTRPTKLERERAERIARGYEKGEKVVVMVGAYSGFISQVIRMASRKRRVVIEGPNGVLTLDVTDIEPVELAA